MSCLEGEYANAIILVRCVGRGSRRPFPLLTFTFGVWQRDGVRKKWRFPYPSGAGDRRKPTGLVWRAAAEAPIVLFGETTAVLAVEADLHEKLPEKARVTVDVWLRTASDVPGARYKLMKRTLLILYSTGDIERARVCVCV